MGNAKSTDSHVTLMAYESSLIYQVAFQPFCQSWGLWSGGIEGVPLLLQIVRDDCFDDDDDDVLLIDHSLISPILTLLV